MGLFIPPNRIDAGAARGVYTPRPIFAETNHLILSRRPSFARELVGRFSAGLRKLCQNGRYERIRRKYSGLK